MSGENEETHDKFDTNGDVPRIQGPGGRGDDKVLKKSTSMYLNVVAPHKPGRPSIDYTALADNQEFTLYGDENYIPSERVQDVLNKVHDPKHRAHKIFSEMDVLRQRPGNDFEWREVSRWVKYEEKMEQGGHRWSKPHVASLSMHYIVELRRLLMDGVLLLDIECYSISQIVERFLDEWIAAHSLDTKLRTHLRTLLLKHHRHLEETKKEKKYKRSMSSQNMLSKVASQTSIASTGSAVSLESMDSDQLEASRKQNERILRKIPKGSEVASIWIGAVDELEHPICGFMRLNDPRMLGDLSEVNLPTRFIFILLGPAKMVDNYTECGRCIATMMVDDIFREVAFKCRNKDDLIAGCDEFLEQVTVLPPGEWDPKIRIEPPSSVPDQQIRRTQSSADFFLEAVDADGEIESHADPDLVISCRPFKGLYYDIKRKLPHYGSDFKDAFHIQCLASFIYIFLATLTPNVTFGGMLGKATAQYLGVMECVFAAAVSGVAFALLSGQPMNILGSTGPMLVLEKIIFDICKDNDWDFLPFRCWVGIWTTGYLLLIVCFDLSALVKYITRFTEESFACLIALIFIYEAFVKVAEIHYEEAPLNIRPDGEYVPPHHCECVFSTTNTTTSAGLTSMMSTVATTVGAAAGNVTTMGNSTMSTEVTTTAMYWSKQMCENMLHKWHCTGTVPDAFVFSIILFLGTFGISIFCVSFKTWSCFPTFVRQLISDFGVLIAIVVMVGFDYGLGLATPKLTVPSEFSPTRSDVRGWLINPLSGTNPWWLYIAAGLPAIIATILIFMDQQITAVIVNRKENKLKKGKGYHLDLLIVALLVLAHSFLGLPWYVAATVSAIAHIQSLAKESECTAPGERPTYLGVREQRVTALFVGILSGVAVLITNILGIIPMPVLYGVFLYMGYSALLGMQFIDRILLFMMPVKYQPDYIYLRHIPLWRVHIFTFIQILCLVALWVVKSIKSISIAFPLLVVFTGFVRKLMECFFTQYELKYLDDILPSKPKKKSVEDVDDNAIPIKIRKELANAAYLSETNGGINTSDEKKPAFYVGGAHTGSQGYTNSAFDTKM